LHDFTFIANLSRSGIARPFWENGTILDAVRTRCIVRRMFFIVAQDGPSRFFFHAHSFTASMLMWSSGTLPQSGSRCFVKWVFATEYVEPRSILATFQRKIEPKSSRLVHILV
jgi:hypothetical protein